VAFQYLKGPTGKLGRDFFFFTRACSDRMRGIALNRKRVDLD